MRGYIINKSKRLYSIGKKITDTSMHICGWTSIVVILYANVLIHQVRQHKVGCKRTMSK